MAARLACIAVPLFPLAARLRSEPELHQTALAVVEGNGQAAQVAAANRLAREAGVTPGQTLPQARALCPNLVARPRDEEAEHAAQEALLEAAERFSPRVEDAGEGVAYLDLAGLERRFGAGQAGEEELGRALAAATETIALPARVGIAGSKLAARVAAGLPGSPLVVPAGEEAVFLAPLPLVRLAPEAEVAATLERWGLRSIGDFARLPAARVASRLGQTGQELHSTALGIDPLPLVPREPPPTFQEGMSLEWPLVSLEPFLFMGRAALERLCRRLEVCGLACSRLTLAFRLEPDGIHERSLDLPAPSRDAKTLLTLVQLELEAHPPGAPVVGFAFQAQPDRPREAQLSLFGPAALSPDKLATTLGRLFALLGPGRVGSPQPVDGHRPERCALIDYAPPPPPEVRRESPRGRGLLAVRVLRPAVALEVITEEPPPDPQGVLPDAAGNGSKGAAGNGGAVGERARWLRPREIRPMVSDGKKRPRLQGEVRVAAGPWAMEEGWWEETAAERDYWDVELAQGGMLRIYRDRRSGDWYADGIYD
jgi:protein ImuB